MKKKSSKASKASTSLKMQKKNKIDDVNNPEYNVKNIVKQSILLEEHLALNNKYCCSCIVKHFLHIIGLSEEACWLATNNIHKYPYIAQLPQFYQTTFNTWLQNKYNISVKLDTLKKLRQYRQLLTYHYFLHPKFPQTPHRQQRQHQRQRQRSYKK